MQDLKKLLKLLLENEVDFVLIGGFAAAVHGTTLVTQDLDICAAITDENIEKLRSTLKDYKPLHRMNKKAKLSFMEIPKEAEGTNHIYLQTDLGILDILSKTQAAGDFETLKKNAIEIPLYGKKCKVISIEDLIKTKESMNRPKDIQAVEELKKVKALKKNE